MHLWSRPGCSRRRSPSRGRRRTKGSPSARNVWGERALARTAGADEDDEGKAGNFDLHVLVLPGFALDVLVIGSTIWRHPSTASKPTFFDKPSWRSVLAEEQLTAFSRHMPHGVDP